MDESRFLVLGTDGQLGRALGRHYPKATAPRRNDLDITHWNALENHDWSDVSVILNAAAYTNVDEAETPKGRESSWLANAQGPANLAKIASKHEITLVHVSSDYVFDGSRSPHPESELFTPLGVYAQTKAAGDIAVATAPKHFIIRVSWLIGDGKNFVRTMTGLADKNISPTVVDDQIGRLTFTETLVDGIDHLLKNGAEFGTYNLSNEGPEASWADIARAIFNELDRSDLEVTGVSTKEYFKNKPEAAPRPLKSTLDLRKITGEGLKIPTWQEKLSKYINRAGQ